MGLCSGGDHGLSVGEKGQHNLQVPTVGQSPVGLSFSLPLHMPVTWIVLALGTVSIHGADQETVLPGQLACWRLTLVHPE